MTPSGKAARPAASRTDIEGTTSAITVVKEVLFPFAEAELDCFLDRHGEEAEVAAILAGVRDLAPGQEPRAALRGWMAADAKVTPLKALQGLIWRQGYEDGRLTSHLYPDVAPCLRAWSAAGLRLCVYSSGSVQAQKLIFGCSEAGDLSPLFSGYFDTTSGPKREVESYRTIAAAIGLPGEEILFLSDVAEELDAARQAGLATCQLVRPEDGTYPSGRHPEAGDFPAVAALFGLPRA